ncbi:hypothetical protein C8R46DRAFT_963179 [Mycena filopes]|nr:hypothetical protein C8R46DRAFT_963179 [Mycena filopes]
MLNHIFKRGVAHLQGATPEYIAKLRADAELYEQAGPDMEISFVETIPVLVTVIAFFLILASIRYTLGTVVATLAMVEVPQTTAVVVEEPKLPAYTDEEPLISGATDKSFDADVEAMAVTRKPLTSNLCATMRHLRTVGGPFARWRGAGVSALYGLAHGLVAKLLQSTVGGLIFGHTLFGLTVTSIATSLMLVRLHALRTHAIIAHPSPKSLLQRIVPRADRKALVLPALAETVAQHATFLLPLAVASYVGLFDIQPEAVALLIKNDDGCELARLAIRVLAVPITAALLALLVLLPATGARARVEAALLPADTLAVVPVDRAPEALTLRAAWRAFDRHARIRVLKVYAKLVAAQTFVALVGLAIVAAEVYVIGGERLTVFVTSARAQLELMAIGE